jgi:hypothetical protein
MTMSRVGTALVAAACMGCLIDSAVSSKAAQIMQTDSFSIDSGQVGAGVGGAGGSGGGQQTLTFTPFDPTLGTLTSVTASFLQSSISPQTISLSASLSITSTSPIGAGFGAEVDQAMFHSPKGCSSIIPARCPARPSCDTRRGSAGRHASADWSNT